ncbi:collagen alpha-1(XII) chain-like [Perca flavescens]|uniref:collagen alpha-1(XII) chain-like n=1 Tax=Perca flavescens TaxID=8167 RepID=UPI00106EC303|nr:collagen alpha-1(XII) chain-like [Perca flavescens]
MDMLVLQGDAQCETPVKLDIVLLLDDSGSIASSTFKTIQRFLSEMVSKLDIGPDRVQIGLVQYSDDPSTKWHLKKHKTKSSLLKAIANLKQQGGSTNTGRALNYTLQTNFKLNVGMRADSKKIAVLITDGESQDDIILPSQKLKDTDIEIYAIAVEDANKMELMSIVSDPKESHVYPVWDSSFLQYFFCSSTPSPNPSSGRQRIHHH